MRFKCLLSAVFVLVSLSGCGKESRNPDDLTIIREFRISVDEETKTTLQYGGVVDWSAGDVISYFSKDNGQVRTYSITESGHDATIQIECSATDKYVVAAYGGQSIQKNSKNSFVINGVAGENQSGQFKDAHVSIARSTDLTESVLNFHSITSLIRFSLNRDDVKYALFQAGGETKIQGNGTVNISFSSGYPSASFGNEGGSSILVDVGGSGTFFISTLPCTIPSFIITLYDINGKKLGIVQGKNELIAKKGTIINLGELDSRIESPATVFGVIKDVNRVDLTSGPSLLWRESDNIFIQSSGETPAVYTIAAGAGSRNAYFKSSASPLQSGVTYHSTKGFKDESSVLEFRNLTVNGGDFDYTLADHDYLLASSVANEDGEVEFNFDHLSAFAKVNLSIGSEKSFSSADIIPTYGEYCNAINYSISTGEHSVASSSVHESIALESVSGNVIDIWLPLAPQELSDAAIILNSTDGKKYSARLSGRSVKAGNAYGWSVKGTEYPGTVSSSISLTTLVTNNISSLPAGQYSGITKISDTRYAVVHDKKLEGGILFFNLTFDNSGRITSSSYEIPAGTQEGKISRDPEGIVYVPSRGTLFVSGEADCKILEYDMDGRPTGKGLEIPYDLMTGETGYESLAYNENTGLFWTVTETPLKKDIPYKVATGDLYRLQSFDEKKLTAAKRYLYATDPAQYTPASGEIYAFGISEVLALDDGKLIVIEREAYVPSNKLASITKVKLYLVDPVNDGSGILSKKLLHTISTSVLSWANYEGICYGPVISGKQSLLMINDSQDRYSGFLNDYINVLSIN